MKPIFRCLLLGMLLFLGACVVVASDELGPITPSSDEAFSSSRQINHLQIASDGTLWAATSGGVLRREPSGKWTKWTRQNGLPSHEARRVEIENEIVRVQFPQHEAIWQSNLWRVEVKNSLTNSSASTCTWRNATWTADLGGLKREKAKEKAQIIALPPSHGTHISALWPRGNALWAALFGDGIWQFNGKNWSRVELQIPAEARDITAMTGDEQTVWLGTRREGIWRFDFGSQRWENRVQNDEPFDTNVQNIVAFDGALWLSTLEDGLVARTSEGWKRFESELSSNAPRQLVVFQQKLWVRHGGGEVDCWDGTVWRKDVFAQLPRKKVLAMSADDKRLYLGQWGGWSEWDGAQTEHFLRFSPLQGLPPMTLLAQGETLWFGTQSRGLIEAKRTVAGAQNGVIQEIAQSLAPVLPQHSYELTTWDERHGLPDDWMTVLAKGENWVAAGTFVGGLAVRSGEEWQTASELNGENVTALAPDGDDLYIATRRGLWKRDAAGKMVDVRAKLPNLDSELQAVFVAPQGLWIGARTGIFFVSRQTLNGLQDAAK